MDTTTDGAVWSRSDEVRAPHRRRWRIVWSTFAVFFAVLAVLSVIGYGAGGLIGVVLLSVIGAGSVGLVAMGSNGDANATVRFDGDDLVINGVIPDRVPVAEIGGFHVFEREHKGASPMGQGIRRKSWSRGMTLIDLQRNGESEKHLLLNGYLPATPTELDDLRRLLATRLGCDR